jgi:hypothetical protein
LFQSSKIETAVAGLTINDVTKAAYTYAIQKYMKHLKIVNPDDLLKYQDNSKFIESDQLVFNIFKK